MKKKICCTLLFLIFIFAAKPIYANRFLVEAELGFFRPFSDVLRDLYTQGWGDYQIEVSYSPFDSRDHLMWRNFFVWGAYDWIYNHGQTKDGIEDSEINVHLHNYSIGLKYLMPMPSHFGIYGSAGARYVFLRILNKDAEVEPRERADGWGSVFALGFLFNPYKWFLVDLYTNVMVKHFDASHFEHDNGEIPKSVNVSGMTFGLGIGICF